VGAAPQSQNVDTSVPPRLSVLLLLDEISLAPGEIRLPRVAVDGAGLLPSYMGNEARVELSLLEGAVRDAEDLAAFARTLGRAVFGDARSWPDLVRRAQDFVNSIAAAMMRRDLFRPAAGGAAPWFTRAGLAFACDCGLDEATYGVYAYVGRVTAHAKELLSAIAADGQPLVDAAHARLAPPPTAEELRAAAEERRHQETLAAQARVAEEQRTRAAAEEAWRAEQRAEQQRQRQAAAKERRQRQQDQDRLLAALRRKKRSRTKPSGRRGRPRDEKRAAAIRKAIREVFGHEPRTVFGLRPKWTEEPWRSRLELLCQKLDERKVSHSLHWESWTHQLHRSPDGRDLVLRAMH
jgi:hypothetical protein